jgi:Leucine-rich repeat (LRR) protein
MPTPIRTPDSLQVPHRGKGRLTGGILSAAVIAFTLIANAPFQYVALDVKWIGAADIDNRGVTLADHAMPMMAGWPCNYWVRYEDGGEIQDRYFSTTPLLLNLSLGMSAAILVYLFIQWRHRRLHAPNATALTRLAMDVGIAVVIILTPGAVAAHQYWQFHQHIKLAQRLTRVGNTHVVGWLPEPIVDLVPAGMKPWMSRIRTVSAVTFRGNEALLQAVADLPTLTELSVSRDGIDQETIQRLRRHHHFATLRLNATELQPEQVASISRLRWLTELSLSNTNFDATMLRELDELKLESVDLRYTKLKLSELGQPGWSQTVTALYLTRPSRGQTDALVIAGWPNLQRLSVTRLILEGNDSPLNLELTNLPSLEVLRIDRLQKHQLVLRDVPRLALIEDGLGDFGYMLSSSDYVPGFTWACRLEIENAPSLSEISCFARDLEALSIGSVPNLRKISLGSHLVTLSGLEKLQSADPGRCQEWIDTLGKMNGPGTVDLRTLPLKGVDLAPIAENRRIRNLNLDSSGIQFDQLQAIAKMKQLESLQIQSCQLKQDQLDWLLSQFDQLESLAVDGSQLNTIRLDDPIRLRFLRTNELGEVDSLRMIDLPQLTTQLRLVHAPRQLEIRNALSLRGLALEEPWPREAVLQGLRDLEWFAAGGPAVDDALLDVLLNCRSLDRLTLAYGALTPKKLEQIRQFPELRVLAVPGAAVDDRVTAHWFNLNSLLDVNFDDTEVDVATIAWLRRVEPLRRLSLSRVPLSQAAIDGLLQLKNLSELVLAEVSIPPEVLPQLFRMPELESIDLSGTPVSESWVEMIRQSKVKHLVLRGSQIEPRVLRQMLDAKPLLYVDMGTIPETIDDETVEELRQRAYTLRDVFRHGWQSPFGVDAIFYGPEGVATQLEAVSDPRQSIRLEMPHSMARINVRALRPQPRSPRDQQQAKIDQSL